MFLIPAKLSVVKILILKGQVPFGVDGWNSSDIAFNALCLASLYELGTLELILLQGYLQPDISNGPKNFFNFSFKLRKLKRIIEFCLAIFFLQVQHNYSKFRR